MPTTDQIHITESVATVRGKSFSAKLRDFVTQSNLTADLPAGAEIGFHNTEYSPLLAMFPLSVSDRVPTQTDRAQLFFDWSKTALTSNDRLSSSWELPDRGPALTWGGLSVGRESLEAWIDSIRLALPGALTHAKFFHKKRDEFRVAYLGRLLLDLLKQPDSAIESPEVIVLGNGYPEGVVGSSHSLVLLVSSPTAGARQAALIIDSVGGELVQDAPVVGSGMQVKLGMTDLFIVEKKVFESLRARRSLYHRSSLSGTGLGYRSLDYETPILTKQA
jgi:hypothetical protein